MMLTELSLHETNSIRWSCPSNGLIGTIPGKKNVLSMVILTKLFVTVPSTFHHRRLRRRAIWRARRTVRTETTNLESIKLEVIKDLEATEKARSGGANASGDGLQRLVGGRPILWFRYFRFCTHDESAGKAKSRYFNGWGAFFGLLAWATCGIIGEWVKMSGWILVFLRRAAAGLRLCPAAGRPWTKMRVAWAAANGAIVPAKAAAAFGRVPTAEMREAVARVSRQAPAGEQTGHNGPGASPDCKGLRHRRFAPRPGPPGAVDKCFLLLWPPLLHRTAKPTRFSPSCGDFSGRLQVCIRVGADRCVDLPRVTEAVDGSTRSRLLGRVYARNWRMRSNVCWMVALVGQDGLRGSVMVEYGGRLRAGMVGTATAWAAAPGAQTERAALDLWWDVCQGRDATEEVVDKAVARYREGGREHLAELLERMRSQKEPLSIPGLMRRLDESAAPAEASDSGAVPMLGEAEDDWELVRDLFLRVDSDHSGVVSKDELHAAIARFGSHSEQAAALRNLLNCSGPRLATTREMARRDARGGGVCVGRMLDQVSAGDSTHQVSVGEFLAVLRDLPRVRGERVQWSRTLGLEGVVARLLPPGDLFDGLRAVRELDEAGVEALTVRVVEGLREAVPRLMAAGVARLRAEACPSAQQLNSKFATDAGVRECDFAGLEEFYRGPEALVGTPNPKVGEGIQTEHCVRANARKKYRTPNYWLDTCPHDEYHFVAGPETKSDLWYAHTPVDRRLWPQGCGWKGECGREFVAIEELMKQEAVIKGKLQVAEVLGVRLYSGPMYLWYNSALRKHPADLYESLEGNRYETTTFCIISAVTKLSKISSIPPNRKLYRGLGGMVLPQMFWRADQATGFRGGVEWGLMSTTADRNVALQYSGKDKQRGTVLEIAAGRIDIGADISSLSQYPGEREFLFPPLSCLEVADEPRVKEGVITVPLRVNLCLKTLTLEQLVERRKELHLAMVKNLSEELDISIDCQLGTAEQGKMNPATLSIRAEYKKLQCQHASISAEEFNHDDQYKLLLAEALEAKVKLLLKHQTAIDLKAAGASDMQLNWCATAPWTDFDTQPVQMDWKVVIASPPSELGIPLRAAPCQAAVLWTAVLQPASPVSRVKMGQSIVKAGQFRSPAVSLKNLGMHHDVFWAAAVGLVLVAPLARLDVREVDFSEHHRAALARAILECTSLVSLNDLAVRNKVGENLRELVSRGSGALGVIGSCQCLGTKHFELKALDGLEWTFVAMRVMVYGWKALNLSDGLVGAADGAAVLAALGLLTSLQSLDLFNNNLGAAGGAAVSALGQLTSLQNLILSCNSLMGAAGGTAVSAVLSLLTSLQYLDLSANTLGPQGAAAVAPALARLTSLERLAICYNALEAEGAAVLLPSLERLANLRELQIGLEDNLGDRGAAHVATALRRMPSLTRLDIFSDESIGEAGKAAVRAAALPSLTDIC